LVTI